jgi:hypothetical protein
MTIPPFPFLAAVCLPDQGPICPSKPLVDFSPSAMADSQETRPPDPAAPKRSPTQAVSAQRRTALAKSGRGEEGPPAAVVPVPAPVPKRAADTAETAQRQRLAMTAKAGSPDQELLIFHPPEEGGGLIPRQDRAARGVRSLPKATAATTEASTTAASGVRNFPKATTTTNGAITTAATGVHNFPKATTTPAIAP